MIASWERAVEMVFTRSLKEAFSRGESLPMRAACSLMAATTVRAVLEHPEWALGLEVSGALPPSGMVALLINELPVYVSNSSGVA